MGAKARFNRRGKRVRLTGFGNGSKGGIFFNGKGDKHLRKQNVHRLPPNDFPRRQHDVPTPTSRYAHKPWPLKRKTA